MECITATNFQVVMILYKRHLLKHKEQIDENSKSTY